MDRGLGTQVGDLVGDIDDFVGSKIGVVKFGVEDLPVFEADTLQELVWQSAVGPFQRFWTDSTGAGKPSCIEARNSIKLATDVSSAERGATQVSIAKVGIMKISPTKIRIDKIGTPEVGLTKGGVAQVGVVQVGTCKAGTAQIRTDQIGSNELGAVEFGMRKHRAIELGTIKIGIDEVGVAEESITEVRMVKIDGAGILFSPTVPLVDSRLQNFQLLFVSH